MKNVEEFMSISDRKQLNQDYLGKIVKIKIDRPIGTPHPKHNEILYPINYGYIPGVLGGDNEEFDVYLLGVDEIVDECDVKIIAVIHRFDDSEDKLVGAPLHLEFSKEEIIEMTNFQEQFYNIDVEMLDEYDFIMKEEIKEGYSHDRKFFAQNKFNDKIFIRESKVNNLNYHLQLKKYYLELEKLDINIPSLLHIKYEEDLISTFYDYLEGMTFNKVLSKMPEEYQVSFGETAGKFLKAIHTIPIDSDRDWESYYKRKSKDYLHSYHNKNLSFENDDLFIKYIGENYGLLKDRPVTFQHGDYHINNFILLDEDLYVIDFDRYDVGDPWEEFNRIVWSVKESPLFASAMIDAYFDYDVPEDFWPLLLYYISNNQISFMSWALNYSDEQRLEALAQGKLILEWHDNFNNVIPSWYQKTK